MLGFQGKDLFNGSKIPSKGVICEGYALVRICETRQKAGMLQGRI